MSSRSSDSPHPQILKSSHPQVRTAGRVSVLFSLALALAGETSAQPIFAGAAVQRDIQRFTDDSGMHRLDGSVRGWSVLGGATIRSHVAVRVETSRQGELDNEQSFTVDIDGRLATIRSRLAYHTRSSSAMGGVTHALSSRVRLAYLAGVSFTRVERTFTTNAPGLTLLPGTAPADTATARFVDNFRAIIVGIDAIVTLARHLALVTGFRRQPLHLDVDITGYSIWPSIGGAWVF